MEKKDLWLEEIHTELAHTYHFSKIEDERKAILPLLEYSYRQMIFKTNDLRYQLKDIDELCENLVNDLPLLFKKYCWNKIHPSGRKANLKSYLLTVIRCKFTDETKRRYYEKKTGNKLIVSP